MKHALALITLLLAAVLSATHAADRREATPAEVELKRQLGAETPDAVLLWQDQPPRFVENAPAETVVENAKIRGVSVPTLSPYLPAKELRNGMAIVVCAGGGHDWKTHVVYAAQVFNPMGVAVIGLKYRTRPPHVVKNEEIQAITLLDAKRAMRLVRHHSAEWGINPDKVGIAGYSAGANLAMNLVANFDLGDSQASDPIERFSSRPDFAVGLGMWHWRKPENPFVFQKNSPPVYLVHATSDKPIEIATNIIADLKKLGVPTKFDLLEEGGHGVGNLIPTRVKHGFPGAQWPKKLTDWLDSLPNAARP